MECLQHWTVRLRQCRVDDHGLYNLVSSITDAGIPAYLNSLVNGADAEKAYAGFLEFRVVVTVPWIL